jgi:signal transduction histidine kinase
MARFDRDGSSAPAPHILVVDDRAEVRTYVREVLELAGHRVSTAPDGLAALEHCRQDPPQVVVTDLQMRPMPGRELIVALKEACPSAVAVVLTGHGTVERTVDLMRIGAFDVLTKPCAAARIAATVTKALEHHVALRANEDLRERLRVQDKLAMIGKLAAGVAHELNNPLDATLRCVRLTREATQSDSEACEYLDLAESGLQRMADIVQSLLTFSRNAAVEQSPQGLQGLVHEAVHSVQLALGDDAPVIGSEVYPDVADAVVARGLHQVITNLLRNACDASRPGQTVLVRARRVGTEVRLEVVDHGSGIPEEIRHRIFEPFFTTKAPGRGTGLGLPLSARLVEKFGGRIGIACPREGGTIVQIVLPLAKPATEPCAEAR